MPNRTLRPGLVISATLLGNTLEWFEYLSFAFFAPILAKVFFPEADSLHSLSHVLGGFFFGYLLRPIGGLVFGYIGDRYGRKSALIASILLMSLPTLGIGLLPTYAQAGAAAIALLLSMRLLQGLATGGEFPSSMTFLVESAPTPSRSFYGSLAYVGMICGVLLGGLDYFLLHRFLPESLYTWGWRITYIFGAFLGCLAFALRTRLHETHPYESLKESHEVLTHPLRILFKLYKNQILKTIGVQALQAVSFNLFISFSIVYFSEILHLPSSHASFLNLIFLFTLLLALPLAGKLSCWKGPRKLMIWSAWGHLLLSPLLYWTLQIHFYRHFSLFAIGILLSSYIAPSVVLICELFPTRVRLSGISLGYNIAVSFFGGLAPLLALSLIRSTGIIIAPAFLIMAAAIISLLTLRTIDHR